MHLFDNFLLTFCIFLLAFLVSVFCSLFCISAIFFWIVQYQKQENTFLYLATIIRKKTQCHLQNPYSIFYFFACWYVFFMVSKIHITDSRFYVFINLKHIFVYLLVDICVFDKQNPHNRVHILFFVSLIWNIFLYICLLIFVF